MVGTPHILVKRGVLNFHFVKRGSRLLKKERLTIKSQGPKQNFREKF